MSVAAANPYGAALGAISGMAAGGPSSAQSGDITAGVNVGGLNVPAYPSANQYGPSLQIGGVSAPLAMLAAGALLVALLLGRRRR